MSDFSQAEREEIKQLLQQRLIDLDEIIAYHDRKLAEASRRTEELQAQLAKQLRRDRMTYIAFCILFILLALAPLMLLS